MRPPPYLVGLIIPLESRFSNWIYNAFCLSCLDPCFPFNINQKPMKNNSKSSERDEIAKKKRLVEKGETLPLRVEIKIQVPLYGSVSSSSKSIGDWEGEWGSSKAIGSRVDERGRGDDERERGRRNECGAVGASDKSWGGVVPDLNSDRSAALIMTDGWEGCARQEPKSCAVGA